MHRVCLYLCVLVCCVCCVFGQKNYHWSHYTAEDGLAQNTVMSMLQDSRGFMWFATWDGLSRFDGYNFTNYKVRPGDNVHISGSRIDYICEDVNGFIWMLTYGGTVCRFDPVVERFFNLPEFPNKDFIFTRIIPLSSGSVWLLSQVGDCVRVVSGGESDSVRYDVYSKQMGNVASSVVRDVFEDLSGNEWLLTDNGICLVGGDVGAKSRLFFDQQRPEGKGLSFFCAREFGDDIWFGSERGRIWRYDKAEGQFDLIEIPTASNVIKIFALREGGYFVATDDDGFFVCEGVALDGCKHFSKGETRGVFSNQIQGFFQDSHGDVWMQQNAEIITRFAVVDSEIYNYVVTNHNPDNIYETGFMIHEDVNDIVWIHSVGGRIFYFDRCLGRLMPFLVRADVDLSLSDWLHSMYSDCQGNLWVCTRAKGLDKFVFSYNYFHLLQPELRHEDISDKIVRAVCEDEHGRFWVATKGGKIFIYDKNKRFLGNFGSDGMLSGAGRFSLGIAYVIFKGRNGVIWIGMKGGGLVRAVPCGVDGSFCYRLSHYKYRADDLYSISDNNVYDIYEDKKGRLWVATFGGGVNFVESPYSAEIKFVNSRNKLIGYPIDACYRTRLITGGADEDIWVATTHGLVVFDLNFANAESVVFERYMYIANDSSCLSNNDVHDIVVAAKNRVFVATYGGGINELLLSGDDSTKKFKYYTVKDGLPSDVILSMVKDDKENLWITTENGISCFNPLSETFSNYTWSDYSWKLNFSEAADLKDGKGNIWFGNQMGVLWFHPDSLAKSTFVPQLIFNDFRLFDKKITPSAGFASVESYAKPIDFADRIVLEHDQNFFAIGYSALDMRFPQSVKYKIKLEGFDKDWRYVDDQRLMNYTNIRHGKYVFVVKSTNSDGVWVENERRLPIVVRPSFWVTPTAWSLYFFVFCVVMFCVGYVFLMIMRLRHKADLDHKMAAMKLDFFTNVSHELRTPLTLITSPLDEIIAGNDFSGKSRDLLLIIKRNCSRMTRLIDQIMDFVKIRHEKMNMTIEPILASQFVNRVMDNFRHRADESQIDFRLVDHANNEFLWVDTDKFEKIIYNLLSNAFKYIGTGSKILVEIQDVGEKLQISVSDDGLGISDEQMSRLFGRFENDPIVGLSGAQPSSGIGLAVVKDFVDMHQALVEVRRNLVQGTTFVLSFFKGLSHYGSDVKICKEQNNIIQNTDSMAYKTYDKATLHTDDIRESERSTNVDCTSKKPDYKEVDSLFDAAATSASEGRAVVLLVEDNFEIMNYMKSVLQQNYCVIDASNGQAGMQLAKEKQPDVIISDLMMPVMDGMAFLSEIRKDVETSHIPFIILSAKSNIESKLEGLDKGADDYITKPFSIAFIKARIDNLLAQRRQLQNNIRQNAVHGHEIQSKEATKVLEITPSQPVITRRDEYFIDNLRQFMEKNIENNELVIEDIVDALGVSRSVFFNKLKALTGQSPIEFVRDFRMKRAAQLIKSGQYPISQVAYMVGINDPRYFSRCFKGVFGLTPKEYMKHK